MLRGNIAASRNANPAHAVARPAPFAASAVLGESLPSLGGTAASKCRTLKVLWARPAARWLFHAALTIAVFGLGKTTKAPLCFARSRASLLPTPVSWCRRGGPCNPGCCAVVCRPAAYCTTPWMSLPSPRASVPLVEGQLQLEGVAVGALPSSNAHHFQGMATRTQRCGDDLVHVWPMAQAREPLPVDEGVRHQAAGTRPLEPSPECRTGS